MNITTDLTISCWIKYNNYNSGPYSYPDVISNADYALSTHAEDWKGYLISAYRNHPDPSVNGALKFVILKPNENVGFRTPERYDDDKWHHISTVFYPENYLRFYIDGEIVNEDTISISSFAPATLPLCIGRGFENNIYQYFEGDIDDVRIYNRVLTDDEILILYHENGWMINPEVTIEIASGNVNLSWDEVEGATSYSIYSSDDPYAGFTEYISGTFVDESWSAPVPPAKKFYYVVAVN